MNAQQAVESEQILSIKHRKRELETEVSDLRNTLKARESELHREMKQANEVAADILNTMLWLYRRLPRSYGRPPAVERSINALAEKIGVPVGVFLSERDLDKTKPL